MKESKQKQKKLKNLLVISSGFPDKNDKHYISIFVKEQVLALSKHFSNIYVFAPYPHNPKLISQFTGLPPSGDFHDYCSSEVEIGSTKRELKTTRTNSSRSTSNNKVHVIFPKYFDIPGRLSDGLRAHRWFRMISSIIDNEKLVFSAIHGHFTYPAGKVAQLLSERYDKPYFVSVHENQDWLKRELSAPLILRTREIWRRARKVFFVNKIEADKLQNRYRNIEWLPNGIDTKRFRLMDKIKTRCKLQLPLDKTILLSVGSLIPIKNYQLLISTVAKLAKTRPDIYCVIIGNGKERSFLLRLVRQLSLQDSVMIVPQLPNDQLPNWYNACDIYCVSSRRESFGITQLEAMACGKPVVATPNGGSQIIIDKGSGIISKAHDTTSFAKAVETALKKHWNSQTIIDSAKKYDKTVIAKKITDDYHRSI